MLKRFPKSHNTMSFSKTAAAVFGLTLAAVARVAAHGTVSGIVADGVYYQGYSPSMQYANPLPKVVGWSIPEDLSNGFVAPNNYTSPDIICHIGATPAPIAASVKAGGTVELQWTPWPESHHGPVIDYLANCNGPCSAVDKTSLKFNKIDGVGLIDDTTVPGNWASDKLIAANNSWTVTIPESIAPGNYVLRHEIIALHSAGDANGAQNYPQCVNLEVTGSGTNALSTGTVGEKLYTATDPGILINIYTAIASYVVPGPALLSGALSGTPPASSAPASSAPVATATATPSSPASVPAPSTPVSSTVAAPAPSAPATTSVPVVSKPNPTAATAIATTSTAAAVPPPAPSSPVSSGNGTQVPGELPAGVTLKDLLQWLEIVLKDLLANQSSNRERSHPRAF